MRIDRRRFIQLSALAAVPLPYSPLLKSRQNDTLTEIFNNPTNIHRPFVRWWWNGDRVTKAEAERELDVLQRAGIGGVEINPIKWPENGDPIGINELQWGSEEWLDVVDTAVRGAKQRGMYCDMIIGSGWPFGGEFVPQDERSEIILLGTRNLEGGKQYQFTQTELLTSVPPPSTYANRVTGLFMLRLAPATMDAFTAGTDLSGELAKDLIQIDVPAGDHVFYYLLKVTGFQTVIQGAAGSNGPVINHYDRKAVENYLNRFGDILTKKLGPLDHHFRAFFTDSIELEGANWCRDMFDQFQQRNGYDLRPYFPYILFKVGEQGNAVKETYGSSFSPEVKGMLDRVRYDFHVTRVALFHERFIATFTGWCRKHGVKSRMQAYGMDCHPLEASMMIDIPECETWQFTPLVEEYEGLQKGRSYTISNKFVSSAAHLAGKQEISCEELTNTGEIFCNTLERIKVTGDQSNLSGVTHSVLHGFNYSPLETPFPGWIRYGTYLSERNTWWPFFRQWADYKSRLSAVFQHGEMQADIGVMFPLADLVAKYGFQRDPFPVVTYPPYVHCVWEAIHQNGYGCDYVSEKIIQQSTAGGGQFRYGTRSYKTLLLIEVETMMPETARSIEKLAAAGCKVIFIGKAPHLTPGLRADRGSDELISGISERIVTKYPKTTGVVMPPGDDLVGWARDLAQRFSLEPYVRIDNPVNHVSQLYYKDATRDIFFFTNYSAEKEHSFRARFDTNKTAWLWDAETGQQLLYPAGKNNELQLSLGPCETRLIVFDRAKSGKRFVANDPAGSTEIVLEGPWQLALHHVNGTEKTLSLDHLTDLTDVEGCKDFAGTITYQITTDIGKPSEHTWLNLGHINDISELTVNGQAAGTRWYGRHLYDISRLVRQGSNTIRIRITTTLGAYTKSLKENKAAQEWSWGRVPRPMGLAQPVKLLVRG